MRNAITTQIQASTAIDTSYGTPVAQPASLGALYQHGGQVVLQFKRTAGTSVTFKIDEYFSETTGWVPMVEDDGSDLTTLERTCTNTSFSFAFTTLAEKIRVYVKGAGSESVEINLVTGEVQ
jgi:hypothetical protein